MHVNWWTKIELRGPGPPGCQHYCCKRVLLYAKMLQETEETIDFFVTFLSLVPFNWSPLPPPSWLGL